LPVISQHGVDPFRCGMNRHIDADGVDALRVADGQLEQLACSGCRGLWRHLMLHLLEIAKQRHCRRTWLEVRRTNRPAILLYRKLGFRTRKIHKRMYPTPRGCVNGLVMGRAERGKRVPGRI